LKDDPGFGHHRSTCPVAATTKRFDRDGSINRAEAATGSDFQLSALN
jgi:hypothetical protein